jgi:hypothetical protein
VAQPTGPRGLRRPRSVRRQYSSLWAWIGTALQKNFQHARMIVQGGVGERRAAELSFGIKIRAGIHQRSNRRQIAGGSSGVQGSIGTGTQDSQRDQPRCGAELDRGTSAEDECRCDHSRSRRSRDAVFPMHAWMCASEETVSTRKSSFREPRTARRSGRAWNAWRASSPPKSL